MKRLLARCWLFLWRWELVAPSSSLPDRCVMIAAPHTANWDFPIMLALTKASGVDVKWLGKASLFRGPMGLLMRRLGGISVDRRAAGGMVAALAGEFAARERMVLIVPAEGTRSQTHCWKSGFYHIARQANVPVVCGFVDGSTRSGGLGPVVHLTGDIARDMDEFRAFYAGKTGLRAGRETPVRLKEEMIEGEAA